jgi:16S rRNA (adenine1518-N6/adenine1519-N6)-dimethyltransferase
MTTDLGFLKNKTYRVIGNLPYNISTQIILKLLDYYPNIRDMHFLVQKEVAEKIASTPSSKDWGKLALKIGSLFSCQILFDVPPDAFDIKPKVNSSFIRLSPKSDLNISASEKSKLFKVIDMAFVSRRKNIRNNLKSFNLDWSKIGVDPTNRPEDLYLKDFLNISKKLEY